MYEADKKKRSIDVETLSFQNSFDLLIFEGK